MTDSTTKTEIKEFAPEDLPEGTVTVPQIVLDIINAAPKGVDILSECIDVAVFLCQKNIAYGNSALNPIRVFSDADSIEQIKVRIDDKLNRLINGSKHPGDDDVQDLLGYLILLRIAEKRVE
jgi:hypothetical protein